jgi:hypothetical protein
MNIALGLSVCRSGALAESGVEGLGHGRGPVGHAELRQERRHVVAYGLLGQTQPMGDLAIAAAAGD